jgi:hypothetical protein
MEEQRSHRGCIAGRMPADFRHGLLGDPMIDRVRLRGGPGPVRAFRRCAAASPLADAEKTRLRPSNRRPTFIFPAEGEVIANWSASGAFFASSMIAPPRGIAAAHRRNARGRVAAEHGSVELWMIVTPLNPSSDRAEAQ